MEIGIGLYGLNGHQIQNLAADHPRAAIVATAACDVAKLPPHLRDGARHYGSLAELLADDQVRLVSLCSPRRRDQAADAIACLKAGRDVYAEKPCAMDEDELDAILEAAAFCGRQFREMGGIANGQPYAAMRDVVRSGVLGTIVQVFAQKSYPMHPDRPQDEDIDGGLIGQNAVHALRMIELVAEQRIASIAAVETTLGNPVAGGGLRMAASLMMKLEGGGVATVIANYLNQPGLGSWGNEHLRIFGTQGFVECTDGGTRTRLVVGTEDRGPLDTSGSVREYLESYLDLLLDGTPMETSVEDEVHATRMTIRAKATVGAA